MLLSDNKTYSFNRWPVSQAINRGRFV